MSRNIADHQGAAAVTPGVLESWAGRMPCSRKMLVALPYFAIPPVGIALTLVWNAVFAGRIPPGFNSDAGVPAWLVQLIAPHSALAAAPAVATALELG